MGLPKWSWKGWLVAAVAAIAVGVTAGPYVYINFIRSEAPERLSLDDGPSVSPSASASASLDGRWTVTEGSIVGYRVKEILFGQQTEGVGRTSDVEGSLTLTGTTIGEATFTADMKTVKSDEERRDRQFRGRIMAVDQYPKATFTLTTPIRLGRIPAEGEQVTHEATGNLTLRGNTRPVTFSLNGKLSGGTVQVQGAIPIVFADWGIPNPSFGPAQTEDNGLLEFLIVFKRA